MTIESVPSNYDPPKLRYKKNRYPQSSNKALPSLFFLGIFCAPRGCGKTYSCAELVRAFEKDKPKDNEGNQFSIRTVVVSPTFDAQECWGALKSIDEDDVFRNYNPDTISTIVQSIKKTNEECNQYKHELDIYKKWMRTKSEKSMTNEELLWLDHHDFEKPEPPNKYGTGCVTMLILDDLVGSSAFKSGKNPLIELALKNRHERVNLCIMTQHIKGLPPALRTNASFWYIGRVNSTKVVQALWEEVASGLVTENEFQELLDEAWSEDHGALCIDMSKPKAQRFSVNMKRYLTIHK